MDETRAQLSERLYRQLFPAELEVLAIDALFDGYPEASEVSNSHFLEEEGKFHGGGSVRRGVLERRVAEAVPTVGGVYEPQHTYRKTNAGLLVPTSHFALFRFGEAVFTIHSVPREDGPGALPRAAQYRDDYQRGRIPKAMIPFAFDDDAPVQPPPPDPLVWFALVHGREPYIAEVPRFAYFAAIDTSGAIAWRTNLFDSQMERVEYWIGQRENTIDDPSSLVSLKAYLRALRHRRSA